MMTTTMLQPYNTILLVWYYDLPFMLLYTFIIIIIIYDMRHETNGALHWPIEIMLFESTYTYNTITDVYYVKIKNIVFNPFQT